MSEETNINVVVRCRGRSEREVRENSGVVVQTNGIKGNTVQLSMGPSALSNKSYAFDKVFSPAADQTMVFDEVVAPILDEVLAGFNCTIFAYGQTGTGKTYTMSGDISNQQPPPDAAGIIPRILHSLFHKLDGDEFENTVKCSFIELYNEELRDLLAPEDNVKLKIFEDNTKKGNSVTMVQGMEETYIKTAPQGIQKLRDGSHKRQVAATKCNDLSSRSHTVFTITVCMKRPSETKEDEIITGKLNLVDLAGSENIQRSGAENKRATEAGLINKSLLTLGRVINALVDKGSHIPYRESKLTRLLQDSLGGRTKTCIIATLSPAKSNLEETISTLDYAFRAKNIRNKPQVNQRVNKMTLLNEFTTEIEQLKSELIATRQRNGIYLTEDSYEQITTVSESRRILSEEQREKIETLEINLRNKYQEIFSLTNNFNGLKKDNEAIKLVLDGTKSVLEKTEIVLAHTKQTLGQETMLRKAHQATESKLAAVGTEIISTLGQTTSDISGLHSKLRRRSDLHSANRDFWTGSQTKVLQATSLVEERLDNFRLDQEQVLSTLSNKMQSFVQDELQKLEVTRDFLNEKSEAFSKSEGEINDQTAKTRDEMNGVLEEVVTLREDVKEKVGSGLNGLSEAAKTISAGIMTEIEAFQTQLHSSYASLGRDFKSAFDDLVKQLSAQRDEANDLRKQLNEANDAYRNANQESTSHMQSAMDEVRQQTVQNRAGLLSQISALLDAHGKAEEQRITEAFENYTGEQGTAQTLHLSAVSDYNRNMDAWSTKAGDTAESVSKTRDNIKAKIKGDFAAANTHCGTLRDTTSTVHDSTTRLVSDQVAHLDTQLHSLDDIVSRIRAQNDTHHAAHVKSISQLSSTVHTSYDAIGSHFTSSFDRIKTFDTSVRDENIASLQSSLPALGPSPTAQLREPLTSLRQHIEAAQLHEYSITGSTPQQQRYAYPSTLPRTEGHDVLLQRFRSPQKKAPIAGSDIEDMMRETMRSPSKTTIFTDLPRSSPNSPSKPLSSAPLAVGTVPASNGVVVNGGGAGGLRELDVNVVAKSDAAASQPVENVAVGLPPLKRQNTTGSGGAGSPRSKLPMTKKTGSRMTVAAGLGLQAERENLGPEFSRSVGAVGAAGRKGLRSQGSS